jgi:hypothetical protein
VRARSINANLGRRSDEHLAVVRRINGELAADVLWSGVGTGPIRRWATG